MEYKPQELYYYRAYVTAVYDGDTFTVNVDHGFGVYTKRRLRLSRVNTPELRGKEKEFGYKVRDIVREMILHKDVEIVTTKDSAGSFNRYLAEVFIDETNLSDFLLENGYAKLYKKK